MVWSRDSLGLDCLLMYFMMIVDTLIVVVGGGTSASFTTPLVRLNNLSNVSSTDSSDFALESMYRLTLLETLIVVIDFLFATYFPPMSSQVNPVSLMRIPSIPTMNGVSSERGAQSDLNDPNLTDLAKR